MSNDVSRLKAQIEKALRIKKIIEAERDADPNNALRLGELQNFQFHIDELYEQLEAATKKNETGPQAPETGVLQKSPLPANRQER
jgi:hypothetical protein